MLSWFKMDKHFTFPKLPHLTIEKIADRLLNSKRKDLTIVVSREHAYSESDGRKYAEVIFRTGKKADGWDYIPWEDYLSIYDRLNEVEIPFLKGRGINAKIVRERYRRRAHLLNVIKH